MAHQVVCRTRVDEPGRALEFTWSVGSSAFPTYALRDDLVEQFRENTTGGARPAVRPRQPLPAGRRRPRPSSLATLLPRPGRKRAATSTT